MVARRIASRRATPPRRERRRDEAGHNRTIKGERYRPCHRCGAGGAARTHREIRSRRSLSLGKFVNEVGFRVYSGFWWKLPPWGEARANLQ